VSAGEVVHGAPPPGGGRARRRRRARAPGRRVRAHLRAAQRAGGAAHGVLLLNSNGMDAVVTKGAVSLRALGGVLDLFVLLGPAPRDVLGQLAAAVGRPALPPFWALGFHQSKCAARLCRRANPVQARGAAASPPKVFATGAGGGWRRLERRRARPVSGGDAAPPAWQRRAVIAGRTLCTQATAPLHRARAGPGEHSIPLILEVMRRAERRACYGAGKNLKGVRREPQVGL